MVRLSMTPLWVTYKFIRMTAGIVCVVLVGQRLKARPYAITWALPTLLGLVTRRQSYGSQWKSFTQPPSTGPSQTVKVSQQPYLT